MRLIVLAVIAASSLCAAGVSGAGTENTDERTMKTTAANTILLDDIDTATSPMHVVFGSIPCYGHWNPLRSVAKAVHRRGHHVTLLMEEDKMKWCTSVQDNLGKKRRMTKTSASFNCVVIPTSKTFEKDFFINMSKSDDIPSSFDSLFAEMFRFTNVTQDAYSKALYVVRELTSGEAGASAAQPPKGKRCSAEAVARARSIGIDTRTISGLCGVEDITLQRTTTSEDGVVESVSGVPPVTLFMTDSGTFPTYAAAMQFGIPSVALFPLSVNLPSGTSTFIPMLGSGKPSRQFMSYGDRLATYVKRALMLILTKFLAVPTLFNELRQNANDRQHNDDVAFPNIPVIPSARAGMSEGSMMTSLIFTPGIWGYDVAQPLCPNIIPIGSTAVGDEDDEEVEDEVDGNAAQTAGSDAARTASANYQNLVVDRRIREFGGEVERGEHHDAAPTATPKPILARRALLEEPLAAFLEDSPACVNYGAVYVNFGTLSVISDETFNRVLAALMHVPFCIVWKIPESARFDRVKAMIAGEKMPEELTKYASSILRAASEGPASSVAAAAVPDLGVNVRGRFYIGKHFASPEAILEHDNTRVFISHCGDTSVLESIHALVPVAGIPIFADQPDVCQRIEESGIGSYVGPKSTFDPERLVQKLIEIGLPSKSAPQTGSDNTNYASTTTATTTYCFNQRHYSGDRLKYLSRVFAVRRMSVSLGGPARAAEVIEQHYRKGLFNVKESMFGQRGLPAAVEERIQLQSSSASASAGTVHPLFTHPQACDFNRLPYVNPQLAASLEGDEGILSRSPSLQPKSATSLAHLTNQMNYDLFWLAFGIVGVVMLVGLTCVKAVLKLWMKSRNSHCGSEQETEKPHPKVAPSHPSGAARTADVSSSVVTPSSPSASTPSAAVVNSPSIRIRAVALK